MAFSKLRFGAILTSIFIFVITSCSNKLEDHQSKAEYVPFHKTYSLSIERPTKTSISDDGKVSWATGDKIKYYSTNNGTVRDAIITNEGPNTSVEFELDGSGYLVAVYGGTRLYDVTGTELYVDGVLLSDQTGRFEDAMVSVAKIYQSDDSNSLLFKNMTSLIKFSLKRTDIKKIKFSSMHDEYISFKNPMKISFSGTSATPSIDGYKYNEISVKTDGSGTFYISTLPITLKRGFNIQCFDDYGRLIGIVVGKNELKLEQNRIVDLGFLDSKITELTPSSQEPLDIDMTGTANCYIVKPHNNCFQFYALKMGCSDELISIQAPPVVKVLWESFGTSIQPQKGDIIKSASYSNGIMTIQTENSGNAVVALLDKDEEVIWSWHIWVTDYNPLIGYEKYANNAGIMMDRNLGALSAVPGDVDAIGLVYQWGRKDPFLGSCSISESRDAASTAYWPSSIESNNKTGTIGYSIANPMRFITKNKNNSDWYYTGNNSTDDTRWNKNKGTYDPCPAGWKVPDGGIDGIWYKAMGFNYVNGWPRIYSYRGMYLAGLMGENGLFWYPAASCRDDDTGKLYQVGDNGNYWTVTASSYNQACAFSLNFGSGTYVYSNYEISTRASGASVRCQAIQ